MCGDWQYGSYECYRQDWYFYASLVAGNLKFSKTYYNRQWIFFTSGAFYFRDQAVLDTTLYFPPRHSQRAGISRTVLSISKKINGHIGFEWPKWPSFEIVNYRPFWLKITKWLIARDNNAEGIVFRKRYNKQELFSGGLKTPKSNLKTYSRNLEKNIFRPKIYDFVIKFS